MQAMSALAFTDIYPSGLKNAPTPAASSSCGRAVTATAGVGSLAMSGGALAAGGACTVTVSVVGSTAGTQINTVPTGGLTATIGGGSAFNLYPASASLVVLAPLMASKVVSTVSDPVNGTANPKAIPGAKMDYTIAVSNPTGRATDAGSVIVTDALPANVKLSLADLGAAGSGPVAFTDGSPATGLTYNFSALSSTTDDVAFSSDGGATFTYSPTANAQGIDPAVTHIRINPKGAQAPATSFQARFRVVVQ